MEMGPPAFPDSLCSTVPLPSFPAMQEDHSRPPSPLGTQLGQTGPAARQDITSCVSQEPQDYTQLGLRCVGKDPSILAKISQSGCSLPFCTGLHTCSCPSQAHVPPQC